MSSVKLGMAKIIWSRAELDAAGKTQRQIQSALHKGIITRVFHGIYVTREPTAQTVWAALEKYGSGQALLDGESAVAVHQGKSPTLPLRIRVPVNGIRRVRSQFVNARASQRLLSKKVLGFRVVSLVDAITTCLEDRSMAETDLRILVDKQFTGETGIKRIASELFAMGKYPKSSIRKFLGHCIAGTDSDLEWKFVNSLRKKGFTTQQNVVVGGYKWDVCIRELKVLIDVDSRRYHGSSYQQTFIVDRWKTNHAQLLGWTALRVTDECLDYNFFDLLSLLNRVQQFRMRSPSARLRKIQEEPVWKWHRTLHSFPGN